jgi:hypothetical protein
MGAFGSVPVQPFLRLCIVLAGFGCGSVDHNGKPGDGTGGAAGANASADAGRSASGASAASGANVGGDATTIAGGANAGGTSGAAGSSTAGGAAAAGNGGVSSGGGGSGPISFAGAAPCILLQPMCPIPLIAVACDQEGAMKDCFIWGTCQSVPGKATCCAGKWVEGTACP